MLHQIRQLWEHIQWADQRIFNAIRDAREGAARVDIQPKNGARGEDGSAPAGPGDASANSEPPRDDISLALREFAHVIGSEETWLSRLEGRKARTAVWPEANLAELETLLSATHEGYEAYVKGLAEADLERDVSYTNSAGTELTNRIGDILLHVALHGQYHRGKINRILRELGAEPAPTDFIAFIRGVPAARTR